MEMGLATYTTMVFLYSNEEKHQAEEPLWNESAILLSYESVA